MRGGGASTSVRGTSPPYVQMSERYRNKMSLSTTTALERYEAYIKNLTFNNQDVTSDFQLAPGTVSGIVVNELATLQGKNESNQVICAIVEYGTALAASLNQSSCGGSGQPNCLPPLLDSTTGVYSPYLIPYFTAIFAAYTGYVDNATTTPPRKGRAAVTTWNNAVASAATNPTLAAELNYLAYQWFTAQYTNPSAGNYTLTSDTLIGSNKSQAQSYMNMMLNGILAANFGGNPCQGATPFQCPNGSCAASAANCTTAGGTCGSGMQACTSSTGVVTCVPNTQSCPGSWSTLDIVLAVTVPLVIIGGVSFIAFAKGSSGVPAATDYLPAQ